MKGYIYDRKGYPRHFENISNQQHTSHYFMSNNTQQRLEQHLFFFVFRVWTIRRGQLYWPLGNGPTCNSCTDVHAMCLRSLLLWINSVLAIQRQCQPCQRFFACSSGNLWSWDSVNNDGVWLVPNSQGVPYTKKNCFLLCASLMCIYIYICIMYRCARTSLTLTRVSFRFSRKEEQVNWRQVVYKQY